MDGLVVCLLLFADGLRRRTPTKILRRRYQADK